MPFAQFFAEQLNLIEDFLISPDPAVTIILADGEMRSVLMRMLVGLDDDPEFPHMLIGYYEPLTDPSLWFAGLDRELGMQLSAHAEMLAANGLRVESPSHAETLTAPWRFLRQAERVANSLPDQSGALVFLLDPERVENKAGFSRSIEFLALETRERWLKFIVLDDRSEPCLAALAAGHPRIAVQSFWLPPEEIGRRLNAGSSKAAAEGGDDNALALAGTFASSNRDFQHAEAMLRQHLAQVERKGAPADIAVGQYTLGNTLLASGQKELAVEAFLRASDICSMHRLHELAPMVYANLGIALHRLGQFDHAFNALEVANRFCKAQGNLPGEAYTCDCLARIHQELGRNDKATAVWRYALKLYDDISNPALQDVREAGRADILEKLERLAGERHAAE